MVKKDKRYVVFITGTEENGVDVVIQEINTLDYSRIQTWTGTSEQDVLMKIQLDLATKSGPEVNSVGIVADLKKKFIKIKDFFKLKP